ncbi:hypothetical protein NO559_05795 [Dasania sp. GY-MA-18]|uniref:Secreted protein n=1 Tax=Dasania phycosphaerae TaxID=2950436 RepID=A0A9J6RKI3_9GAMM|nr:MULTISPECIES: hypothetical protein [Dasania]MCR8922275.1 hypothetical protein [Dasania sp. GY-MA-18]MCZ0864703.1 hypothetical protein [Dasania phycosphaerae]MCZ0868431.1 hypothetical protein [Dasania phycosphaerae]
MQFMKGFYRTVLASLLVFSLATYNHAEQDAPKSQEPAGLIEQLLEYFGLADEADKPATAADPKPLSQPAVDNLTEQAAELLPIQPLDLRLPEGSSADDSALDEAKPTLPNLFAKPAQPKSEAGRISVSGKPLLKFGEAYTDAPKVEGADISVEMKID